MRGIKIFINRFWPIGLLMAVSLVLFLSNYTPGTYLLGWDNTVPELNLSLNFSRFLFGVWQEYRGLGTLDGMAHTANIIHWFYSAFLSIIFPTNVIRYLINILTHLFGGIGIYFLMTDWVIPYFLNLRKKKSIISNYSKILIGLIVAFFYMFNLMTIQMYHMPLEAFSFHFMILPWGAWTLLKYLHKPNVKGLFLFFFVNILGVSQAHIPTIFIVYALLIGTILLFHLVQKPMINWRSVFLAGFTFLAVNSFWALPYGYTVIHKSGEIANSKQNRFGTDSIFYRNFARGDLKTIMTYGGFRLDYQDWNIDKNEFEPVMKNWLPWYSSFSYQLISISFSLLAIIGVAFSIKISLLKRNYLVLSLAGFWFFVLTMLGTNIPIIGTVFKLLQNYVPLFYQVFRFTFTKFSMMYVFLSSLFIGISLLELLSVKFIKRALALLLPVVLLLILYSAHPVFSGNFFYSALRVKLPEYYQSLINDFNDKSGEFRYATFPIHSFWGWTTNTNGWGYRGSGFLWQAIRQPMVDRSFDPWSKDNETMYLQMNRSLYQGDSEAFTKTFDKYFTDYILFDNSVFHPGNYKEVIFENETKQFFSNTPEIEKEKTYGGLEVYKFNTSRTGIKVVTPETVTLLSNEYITDYTTRDQAFIDYGNYLQDDSVSSVSYPFSYLQREELQELPQIVGDGLIFEKNYSNPTSVVIPPIKGIQDQVETLIYGDINEDILTLKLNTLLPEVTFDNIKVTENEPTQIRAKIDSEKSYYLTMNQDFVFIDSDNLKEKDTFLNSFKLPLGEDLSLSLFDAQSKSVLPINESSLVLETEKCSSQKICYKASITTPTSKSDKIFVIYLTNFQVEEVSVPEVCFHGVNDTECIGESFLLEKDHNALGVAVTVLPDTQYEITLSSPVESKPKFNNTQLQIYDEINKFNISLSNVVTKFDESINRYQSQKFNHLLVKIPFGEKNRVVINEAWNSLRAEETTRNCQKEKLGNVNRVFDNGGVEYMASNKAIVCDSYKFPEINQSWDYLFNIKGEVKDGIGLKGFLLNPYTKRFDIEMVTGAGKYNLWFPFNPSKNYDLSSEDDTFVFSINGETYGFETNHSIISGMSFYPVPLNWLAKIHSKPELFTKKFTTKIIDYSKLGSSFYYNLVNVSNDSGLIVLPQSFDNAWLAVAFSSSDTLFPISYSLLPHHKYNGWANSWYLPEGESKVFIIFWPQLLSFFSYIFLVIGVTYFIKYFFSRKNKKTSKVKDALTGKH